MAPARKKSDNSGWGILFLIAVAIALIVTYWEIFLGVAAAGAVVWILVRFVGRQPPQWRAALGWSAAVVVPVVTVLLLWGGDKTCVDKNNGESLDCEATPAVSEDRYEAEFASSAGGAASDSDGPGGSASSRGECCFLVTRVIDGDTVEMEEFNEVRLIGVDTPEKGKCYDDAATNFTERQLLRTEVGVELGEETKDRYGRTLAYLYRGKGMHNLALVQEGYAKALTIPPNDKYASRFEQGERSARATNSRLWRACDAPSVQRPTPSAPSQGDDEREHYGGGGGGGGLGDGEDNFDNPLVPFD